MAALVIDVGRLYQERAELQNGADAAAIGVAKSCALGTCDPAVATSYADANASALTGNTAGVPMICGSGDMGSCPGSTGTLADCPEPPPPAPITWTCTRPRSPPAARRCFPPPSPSTLLGNSGYQGTTVHACAQAEWGAPASATTTAVAISACEWDQATQQGALFAPASASRARALLRPSAQAERGQRQRLCDRACGRGRARQLRLGGSSQRQLHLAHQRLFLPGPHPPVDQLLLRAGPAKRTAEPDSDPGPCLRIGERRQLHPDGLCRLRGHRIPPARLRWRVLRAPDLAGPREQLPGRRLLPQRLLRSGGRAIHRDASATTTSGSPSSS